MLGAKFDRVLELGSQTMTAKVALDPAPATPADFYATVVGTQSYDAIDIDGRGTMILDLNQVHDLGAKYDLVTNNGTGEHIFNQAAVWETIHGATKAGGLILCVLPWINWRNHAFYNFHPCFFRDLATENGYDIVDLYGADREGNITHEHVDFSEDKKPEPTGVNVSIVCAMRKLSNADFKVPTHGKYRRANASSGIRSIFKPAVVELVPFPHAVFTLDADLFSRLDAAFPSPSKVVNGKPEGSNLLLQRDAKASLEDATTGDLWRGVVEHLTSADALQEMLRLFGHEALKRYPHLGSLPLETGVRNRDAAPFVMDAQFAVNTPVKKAGSVRGPHIDDPRELIAGLVYFSGNHDGGNLEFYRWKGERRFTKRPGIAPKTGKPYLKASECELEAVEHVATIETTPGTAVFFLNTPDSIHGVAPRRETKEYRRYLNVICEVGQPLFELE